MENEFEKILRQTNLLQAPMFSRVYKLSSVENSGSFTWHGYNINLLKK